MRKIIENIKKHYLLYLLVILVVPSFFRMLQYGMYSTQDFHLFRLVQFDKCVKALTLPCRWAPDAGLGFGEPLFNFYGQLPYFLGELFYFISGSFIDSIKILFILSLAGSGIAMYFLSKKLWGSEYAGLFSALLYIYAPYRAVDVWVRGALSESLAFVLFPLIILAIEKKSIWWLSLLMAILITTHNLSFLMFAPVAVIFLIYKRYWNGFSSFVIAGFLSAFYVLPVIFESRYIDLESTTKGYFDFRAHFITLKQIFFDNTWAYGASTWGTEDGLNLSVGIVQWVVPVLILFVLMYRYIKTRNLKVIKNHYSVLLLIFMGIFYLFLTHNKSTFVWNNLSFMPYIQFPWRFLGMGVFVFSLVSGYIFTIFTNRYFKLFLFGLIGIYTVFMFNYFKPDIWYTVSDKYYLTGEEWDRQRSASIGDFWPLFGHAIPEAPSDGQYINYFPGWVSKKEPENGLIEKEGSYLKDTPIRKIGNIVSLVSVVGFIIWKRKQK